MFLDCLERVLGDGRYSGAKLTYLLCVLWAVARNKGKFGVMGWLGEVNLQQADLQFAFEIAEH